MIFIQKNWIKIVSFGMLFFVSTAFFSPERARDLDSKIDRFDLSTISLCAPIDRPTVDFGDMMTPLAPSLDYSWDHSFDITTESTEAQKFFNQGLFFTYGFNHAEAERSFKEAIRLDQNCAMAYWGLSLTLGPNINRYMLKTNYEDAYTFMMRAMELKENCTPKEKALIEALSTRYIKNATRDRKDLDIAYANAMRNVAHRFREDTDVLALFCEAMMDTMPWDYWEKDGSPKPETQEIHATLDYILEKDPGHPGANHYYIHSVEAIQPELAERAADKLTEMKYNSGHLVHMPSHIYIRLGRYQDANKANQDAIDLDEDYIEQCQAQGYYPAVYYPHNVHFLWFGASMSGQSELAIKAAKKTAEKGNIPRFRVTPLYALMRFGKWDQILQEPEPAESDTYINMFWHFTQGFAHAKKGNTKEAKKELSFLKKFKDGKKIEKLGPERSPLRGMAIINHLMLQAELVGMEKDFAKKVELIREATNIQSGFRYMEPPYYYFQIRQALGAALIEAGKNQEAEKEYRQELDMFPDNGWSLFGLYQSLKAQGKNSEAQEIYQQYKEAWKNADVELTGSIF